MVKPMAEALMGAEADTICGAGYGERSEGRTNRRNGYREWDTRAGTVELAIPKLRSGSYFPEWLLERRRMAEQALVSVVATSYLLGVSTRAGRRPGGPTRDQAHFQEPGLADEQGPGRPSGGVSRPQVGHVPLLLFRIDGRAHAEGP